MLNGVYLLPEAEFNVAVDNGGLWPVLTVLPGGEIVAAVYDHPSHGYGNGNIELWASTDGGSLWKRRSTVSDHEQNPGYVRMNHAIGRNKSGDLVALVAGYREERRPPRLPLQVCISNDSGHTWKRHEVDCKDAGAFGNIVLGEDGTLSAAIYQKDSPEEGKDLSAYIYRSKDNGQTWSDRTLIRTRSNETALLRCRNGRWLAAVRLQATIHSTEDMLYLHTDQPVHLLTSGDEGRTWSTGRQVSFPSQHPGHLLELDNGYLILSCGTRIPGLFGVVLRYSTDGGESWSEQVPLISISEPSDCGYPSSVQLQDGTIVTAFYYGPKVTAEYPLPNAPPWHCRYHMGVARWRLESLMKRCSVSNFLKSQKNTCAGTNSLLL